MTKTRVKILVSNKGPLLEERLNKELDKLEQDGYFIRSVETNISFAGEKGYQAIGTIVYEEYMDDDLDFYSGIGLFDNGEPVLNN